MKPIHQILYILFPHALPCLALPPANDVLNALDLSPRDALAKPEPQFHDASTTSSSMPPMSVPCQQPLSILSITLCCPHLTFSLAGNAASTFADPSQNLGFYPLNMSDPDYLRCGRSYGFLCRENQCCRYILLPLLSSPTNPSSPIHTNNFEAQQAGAASPTLTAAPPNRLGVPLPQQSPPARSTPPSRLLSPKARSTTRCRISATMCLLTMGKQALCLRRSATASRSSVWRG